MSKIVVEIDGVRHVMKKKEKIVHCKDCSLNCLCFKIIGYMCLHSYEYFVKEEDEDVLEKD